MSELDCPKCGSLMRTIERSGLALDQCTGCRGVFLDRGELERLVDAEGAYYEPVERHHEHYEEHRPYRGGGGLEQLGGLGGLLGGGHGHGHGHGHHKRHKRESFLSELFDD